MMSALISERRKTFHKALVDNKVLTITRDGVASNADSGNTPSKVIARIIAENLNARIGNKLQGQTAGTLFEQITAQFLASTFPELQHLRPGSWHVANLGNQNSLKTSDFAQYEHLHYLAKIIADNRQLSTMLGNDYMTSCLCFREVDNAQRQSAE